MSARAEYDAKGAITIWWVCDACHAMIRSHTPRAQTWHPVRLRIGTRHACSPVCLVNVLREWAHEIEREPVAVGAQTQLV